METLKNRNLINIYNMLEKKRIIFKSPDITQMQEVIINYKTKIYIAVGADPEEARNRHMNRPEIKGKLIFARKKPVTPEAEKENPQILLKPVLSGDPVLKMK
jgi:hypothetical protein